MELSLHDSFPENLQDEWNDLLAESATHVPFLRYEYLTGWWATRGGGEWPQAQLALVTARQDGKLVGAAPLFQAEHQGSKALLLVGSIEISDYLDLLARPADMPAFLHELLPFLNKLSYPWKALDLYNILDHSSTLPALEVAVNARGWQWTVTKLQHSPYIRLPGDWETYLAGIDAKQRHEIRRKMRKVEESGLPVRYYVVEDPATIDAEAHAFIKLMENDSRKAAFLTPAMRQQMVETIRCAFESHCLYLAFLEINNKKAAGYFNFDFLNRLWVYNSGFDFSLAEYSPGWVLLGNMLKWANENHREAVDFMRGDEQYKYRFGAIDRYVMRATARRGD